MEKPYGYRVTILRRALPPPGASSFCSATETHTFRRKGSEAAARHAAKLQRRFIEVLSLEPYTKTQWEAVFGEGRM